MPIMNPYSVAQQATLCAKKAQELAEEAVLIDGPEREDWTVGANRWATEARLWEKFAEQKGWETTMRHASTMATIAERWAETLKE